jgi:hypothetical protein
LANGSRKSRPGRARIESLQQWRLLDAPAPTETHDPAEAETAEPTDATEVEERLETDEGGAAADEWEDGFCQAALDSPRKVKGSPLRESNRPIYGPQGEISEIGQRRKKVSKSGIELLESAVTRPAS